MLQEDLHLCICRRRKNLPTHEDCKLLQLALAGLQCWSQKWLLSLNIKKCCIVSYGRSFDKTTTYALIDRNNQEVALERCDKFKDLGMWFDCHLENTFRIKLTKHI